MKVKRICFFVVFSVVFVLILSGCSVLDACEAYGKDKEICYVAFSGEKEKAEPMDYKRLENYKSEWSPYNSYVLYKTLSEDEKRIYRFYEYAMDQGFTSIFIDERLTENLRVTPLEILSFFTMDSAFVSQNYEYTEGETEFNFSYLNGLLEFDVEGIEISTQLFKKENIEKRKEVLSAANDVLKDMPKDLSDLEKARYFYRYLTGEVEYYAYENGETEVDYLHDAFYQKKTQCDGFANAFSLLCALERIPSFEKIYNAEGDELGHTWNCFFADGAWYNADCAISQELVENQEEFDMDLYFGFSDERQEQKPSFASRLPSCIDDLIPVDLSISSPSDPTVRAGIGRAFSQTEKKGILIRIANGSFGEDDLKKIADYLQSDLRSIPVVWNGVNHLYLFRVK